MKILSADQIKEGDRLTIEREPISSVQLMERAGRCVVTYLEQEELVNSKSVTIFCGVGNNGGDGLVIARLLAEKGFHITVYIIHFKENYSTDFNHNLNRLKATSCRIITLYQDENFPVITENSIVLDAIFGIGINRNPEPWVQNIICYISQYSHRTISIDIPSGLFMDRQSQENQVVNAHLTLSFQVPKLVFYLKDSAQFVGDWRILDIGIDRRYLKEVSSVYTTVDQSFIQQIYKPRKQFTHKGTYGHGLIIGGEYGKIGALILSAKACLHSGAGLVSVYSPRSGYLPLQTAIPEVMVMTDKKEEYITNIPLNMPSTAIGIGPGLGTNPATVKAFETFIQVINQPLVIDADGINILSRNRHLISLLPSDSILTPHPKELQRLIGETEDDFDQIQKTIEFSVKHKLIILIKGAYSKIVSGNQVYINTTGNQGMATAGSGDVLTGIITGLLAQNYIPLHATILGVYLHGFSGDQAYKALKNYHTITASTIIEYLPKAFEKYK